MKRQKTLFDCFSKKSKISVEEEDSKPKSPENANVVETEPASDEVNEATVTTTNETDDKKMEDNKNHLIGGCIDQNRFNNWRRNRPWLSSNSVGHVFCLFCSEAGALGVFKDAKYPS